MKTDEECNVVAAVALDFKRERDEARRERDELFARIADLSWEKMSSREQAVWAAAFAYMEIWSGPAARSLTAADAAVKALREVLK